MDVCIEPGSARRRTSDLRHLAEQLRAADWWPNRAIDPFGACAAILRFATCFRTQAWTPARSCRAGAECACSRRRQLKHDPEKWEPVSRLREALITVCISSDASAGEGKSEKIMLKQKS